MFSIHIPDVGLLELHHPAPDLLLHPQRLVASLRS